MIAAVEADPPIETIFFFPESLLNQEKVFFLINVYSLSPLPKYSF